MKATIITTKGTKIEGKLSCTKTYIISLDVDKQLVDAQYIKTLYKEGISATEFSKDWQIIIERSKVQSITFED
jgi:hypothetical protein